MQRKGGGGRGTGERSDSKGSGNLIGGTSCHPLVTVCGYIMSWYLIST